MLRNVRMIIKGRTQNQDKMNEEKPKIKPVRKCKNECKKKQGN